MGQKRTLFTASLYVPFALESRHSVYRPACPLSANSGHSLIRSIVTRRSDRRASPSSALGEGHAPAALARYLDEAGGGNGAGKLRLQSTHQRVMLGIPMSASQRVNRGFHRLSAAVALIVPTLVLAQDKSAVLENCKLKAIEVYGPSGELSRASEHVVACMIAAGYRIDPSKVSACYGSPTVDFCFIPR
jgi:hypothetical protein